LQEDTGAAREVVVFGVLILWRAAAPCLEQRHLQGISAARAAGGFWAS